MSDDNQTTQFEGYLQKKCVLLYWVSGSAAVPKLWKYVTRYFFVIGNTLCYTKSKRDKERKKKYRIILTLSHIKDIVFTDKKITISMTSGQQVSFKSESGNIQGWIAFLVPFKNTECTKQNNNSLSLPRTFPRRREAITKYPPSNSSSSSSFSSSSSISSPSISLSSLNSSSLSSLNSSPTTPTFIHPPTTLSAAVPRKQITINNFNNHSSASSSARSSPTSSPTITPRSEMLIDERVPWREAGTLRPYKPHESSETYVPFHSSEKDLLRLRSSSKSPCTSSGSLVSSWSMNNIAEWDEPETGVAETQTTMMSWDEWDAIFIKSQSIDVVSQLSSVA